MSTPISPWEEEKEAKKATMHQKFEKAKEEGTCLDLLLETIKTTTTYSDEDIDKAIDIMSTHAIVCQIMGENKIQSLLLTSIALLQAAWKGNLKVHKE